MPKVSTASYSGTIGSPRRKLATRMSNNTNLMMAHPCTAMRGMPCYCQVTGNMRKLNSLKHEASQIVATRADKKKSPSYC